jgi:hypothetical protein
MEKMIHFTLKADGAIRIGGADQFDVSELKEIAKALESTIRCKVIYSEEIPSQHSDTLTTNLG